MRRCLRPFLLLSLHYARVSQSLLLLLPRADPSIGWSTYFKKFIAVGSKVWDCSDIVFTLSDDLVNWSKPYPLYQPVCHNNAPHTNEGYYAEIYPSLMDPASPSPNFDVVGEFPYIYFGEKVPWLGFMKPLAIHKI